MVTEPNKHAAVESSPTKVFAIVPIIGAAVGIAVGSIGMWWTMEERLEKRVAERVKLESRVARLEERIEGVRSEFRSAEVRATAK